MNSKNFGQHECGREFIPNKGKKYASQKNEKNPAESFSEDENVRSIAEDFEIFLEISKILAEQEYRKRRFLKIIKLAFFAVFGSLLSAGIIIFAKRARHTERKNLKKKRRAKWIF